MIKYFLVCLLFVVNAFGLESLKLDEGRYVAVENNVINAKKPTFIFLPGINRGLDARDAFMQLAKKSKLSFVSMHFSLHPESVMLIPKNEVPYFKFHRMSAKDLADEVLSVIATYKIEKPIVVGLSYSSLVTSELAERGELPFIIETAPMMRPDESDPANGQITDFWKNYYASIPFTGPYLKEVFLQNIYTYYWSTKIDGVISGLPEDRQSDSSLRSGLVGGYAALSISADGFDFSKQKFSASTKRLFILGENELPARYELQQKAITAYEKQTGLRNTSVVLPGAGHIIPSDAPEAYMVIIKESLKLYKEFTR
jgi:pimeloyl-ACP methyl ester carboxylesterase